MRLAIILLLILLVEFNLRPRIERARGRVLLFYGLNKRNYIVLWKL